MNKSAAGPHPPPPGPLVLPRKSLDLAYASSATEHRRSSSDVATPTQASQLGRPLVPAVSVQDLKRVAGSPILLPGQQTHPLSSRYPSGRSFTDQSQSRQSPIKSSSPRKKTSNPNILSLQSGINSKMHRLTPTTSIGSNPSVSTLSLPTSTLSSALSSNNLVSLVSVENPWQTLHVFVLPLFNGEQLGQPIEDLNVLVKQHIKAVVSRGFSRALATLESDVVELLNSGMLTLSAKLGNLEDEKLLPRLIEIWILFYDQVLPYVEGVFLPVHTDGLILSLNRPKMARATSPPLGEVPLRSHLSQYIDVRTLTLRSFRDKVLTPFHTRIKNLLSSRVVLFHENIEHSQSRFRQMLLVLVSIGRPGFCDDPFQSSSLGEQAVLQLLRAASHTSGHATTKLLDQSQKLPSFLSAGIPRDRRGRIARKSVNFSHSDVGRGINIESHRDDLEREKQLLAGLRSPNPDDQRGENVGWGLGCGQEIKAGDEEGEEEEEGLEENLLHMKSEFGVLNMRAAEAAQDGRSLRRKASQS